jgi:hypothetical protein
MNIDCFLKRFTDVLCNDKQDDIFNTVSIITGGTTSARIAKLLNFAVSQIDDSECYLEVGVYLGTTLCSAGLNNEKTCVGIDNYNQGSPEFVDKDASKLRDRCLHNINSMVRKATLIEKDFHDVTKEEIPKPVAVSFIDGRHDFDGVTDNLKWLEPLLADNAIIVFDDINYFEVSDALGKWMSENYKNYEMLCYIKPFYTNCNYISSIRERFLNNGIAIIKYGRNGIGSWVLPQNPEVKS